jgi:hypothetical protein
MIDTELAGFLEQGLGIHLAARDASLRPHGVRAAAIKVEEDGAHLVVYVAEVAATRVLGHLEANGQVAVDVGRPVDDRACQVKGLFLGVRPALAGEQVLVEGQWRAYRAQLAAIGIAPAALEGWTVWPAVAIRIKPTALFEQTPGPFAGTPLS